ncbi:hypothetical protein OG21DRAFT_1486492 [Imleria badia]|nr:hypothetical protein OG21DRAFT_1486492 [Imleria badia]
MSRHAGIPLLSGPPPPRSGPSQSGCRKCGREFSILFNRRRECMHCGYDYCSSCTDYQALLPRRSPTHGYDLTHVCAYCIELLNVTALGRMQLRSLQLAKLRRYIDAYNIPIKNPIDKNDLVDAAIAARTPQGCLSPVNENYYRKHSVPLSSTPGSSPPSSSANRNSSTRAFPSNNANNNTRSNRAFPRPDLDPDRQQRPQEAPYSTYTPRPAPNEQRSRTTSAPLNPGTTRPTGGQPNVPRPTSSAGRQSTPRTDGTAHASSHSQSAPPPPPPPMSTLVTLPRSSLSALSVGTLKQILWEARVRVPPGVVEKEELVERVWALVEEEKRKNDEGDEDVGFDMDEMDSVEEPDREEEAVVEMVDPESEAHPDIAREHGQGFDHHRPTTDRVEHGHVEHGDPETHEEYLWVTDSGLPSPRPSTPQLSTSPPNSGSPSHSASKFKPRPHPKPTSVERSGLCVVCQDEEACIAIVDCGYAILISSFLG